MAENNWIKYWKKVKKVSGSCKSEAEKSKVESDAIHLFYEVEKAKVKSGLVEKEKKGGQN